MGFIGAGVRRLNLPDVEMPSFRVPQRFRFYIPHARGLLVSAILMGMLVTVASAAGLLALRRTDAVEAAAQEALRRQFISGLVAVPLQLENEPAAEGKIPAPVQFVPEQPAPIPGTPIARIQIPAIGVDKVVVEGTGVSELQKGPGHYPGTVMPGEGGTFGVAGYRATYGAPFLRLDKLEAKTPIYVTTSEGVFAYQVAARKTVEPKENSLLVSDGTERLVITTTAPSIDDSKRLVVVAEFKDHSPRATVKVELPAGEAGAAYTGEDQIIDSFELNPLGRLAATNVTPSRPVAPPAPPSPPPAPPAVPAPPAAPPAAPPPAGQPQNPAPAPQPPPPPAPVVLAQPPAPAPAAPSPQPTGPVHRRPNPFAPACRNGIDDDGDGLIDFRSLDDLRQDTGCNGENDDDE